MLAETSKDPLLGEICRRILADESRHMGFGMLSLPRVVAESSEQQRLELEEVTEWAVVKTLKGMFPYEPYREMGFDEDEIEDIRRLKRERQAGGEAVVFRQIFRKELDSTLLANLARVGLLNERSRGAAGLHRRANAAERLAADFGRAREPRRVNVQTLDAIPSFLATKKRAVLFLRWVVIVTASYLVLFDRPGTGADPAVALFVVVFLMSNLLGSMLPARAYESLWLRSALVLFDTAWISVRHGARGRAEQRAVPPLLLGALRCGARRERGHDRRRLGADRARVCDVSDSAPIRSRRS